MKNKRKILSCLIILLVGVIYYPVQAQQKHSKSLTTSAAPNSITRNIIQDKKGNIWIASWEGIFRYDGKSFTNITNKVSSARFFSVLEDRKGNFWFGSIGSGAFYYDGKSFTNFTTKEGLASNDVTCIYEDKIGNIWFGASCYDGKSFRNYNEMPNNDNNVNSIIEDKIGKFWFGTRGKAFVYNGKTFTVLTHDGKPFTNVRTIIKDKKGNIWLGGTDGLWRYDGHTFTNLAQKFVGYIYEDREGNIWTSSETAHDRWWAISHYDKIWTSPQNVNDRRWAISRYDEKSLFNKKPTVTEITNKPMTFGILEAFDGSIWFGALDGVYHYDGKTITDFKGKEVKK